MIQVQETEHGYYLKYDDGRVKYCMKENTIVMKEKPDVCFAMLFDVEKHLNDISSSLAAIAANRNEKAPAIDNAIKWVEIKHKEIDNPTEFQKTMLVMNDGQALDIYDNEMPADRQCCMITTKSGDVDVDVFYHDDFQFFHYKPDDVIAWAPLPEPYKKHSKT